MPEVTRLSRCFRTLEKMEELGLPLLIHGESTDPAIDVFDREKGLSSRKCSARRSIGFRQASRSCSSTSPPRERCSTWKSPGPTWRATITAHHLLMNRNALFRGRDPAASLLPAGAQARGASRGAGRGRDFRQPEVLPRHRQRAASAHGTRRRPAAAPASTPATRRSSSTRSLSNEADALGRLEGFASEFGARFYGLPPNEGTVTLARKEWTVPLRLKFGDADLVPLRAGETLPWKLA
jgi:dihydroorotase